MKINIKNLKRILEPYSGILLCLVLLFFFHFSWKIAIDGDMDGTKMYIFGKEWTPAWFDTASLWLAKIVHWVIRLFPGSEHFILDNCMLYYIDGGIRINIIWGCTGLKQMFIFSGIILFYRGPFLKKLWYIPLGCTILTLYNIIRIALICVLTNQHPERFDSLHDGVFRYIYYTIVFLLWVAWEEFFVKKRNDGKQKQANATLSGENAG
jgi:Transmembrane exosortase (Exosortase_EpsH).